MKGACREELKKIKHVVQYAIFAAYHLSLETSFLADEGATLPKMRTKHTNTEPDRSTEDINMSIISKTLTPSICPSDTDAMTIVDELMGLELTSNSGLASEHLGDLNFPSYTHTLDYRTENMLSDECHSDLTSNLKTDWGHSYQCNESEVDNMFPSGMRDHLSDLQESVVQEERQHGQIAESTKDNIDEDELSSEYFSATDSHQSILVYFSNRCVSKGTVCEQSRLLRIKFYGSFDKPLGRYLRDDLFDQVTRVCFVVLLEPLNSKLKLISLFFPSLDILLSVL